MNKIMRSNWLIFAIPNFIVMISAIISLSSCGGGGSSSNDAPSTIQAPTLSSPANNATITTTMPTLNWSNVNGANEYKLMIDTTSGFAANIVVKSLTVSSYTLSSSEPLSSGKYYWKVQCKGSAGNWSDWSSTYSFTISTTTVSTGTVSGMVLSSALIRPNLSL